MIKLLKHKSILIAIAVVLLLVIIGFISPLIHMGSYESYFCLSDGNILEVRKHFWGLVTKYKLKPTEMSKALKSFELPIESEKKYIPMNKTDYYVIGRQFNDYIGANAYYKDVFQYFYLQNGNSISKEKVIDFKNQLTQKYCKYILKSSDFDKNIKCAANKQITNGNNN